MAEQFNGFTADTTEMLMGIRMNNTKEWFEPRKADYKAQVTTPLKLLADEVCAYMQAMDSAFAARPKVSRPYRDTRFTKNRDPIKECAWFFLRNDSSPGIQHDEPTFFFEITPDMWRCGLGFWPMKASGMAAYRRKIEAAPDLAARLVREAKRDGYFDLEGDMYKKKMHGGGILPEAAELMQMKNLTFIHVGRHDKEMCSRALLDVVCEDFKSLYPMQQFFMEVSRMCTDTNGAK